MKRVFLTHTATESTQYTELLDDIRYPQRVHWFPESYAKAKTGLQYPPQVILSRVLRPEISAAVAAKPVKTAFIYAAGTTSLTGSAPDNTRPTRLTYTYKMLPLMLTNVYAGRIAQQFGQIDSVQTDCSACASGVKVLTDVLVLMRHYGYDRVVVLAGEDPVSNLALTFFGEAKASLLAGDTRSPSAFDPVNGGFYVGQGAALAVFESEAGMSAPAVAELKGAYFAGERSTNPIGQLESGEGFKKAIIGALADATVGPEQIAVVKTHGTGTDSNNKAERNALDGVLVDFVATSYKPTIGHTMGASGLLESILLINNLREHHFVPKIANRTEHDTRYLSEDTAPGNGLLLSIAAGMGNIYAAAIFDWRA